MSTHAEKIAAWKDEQARRCHRWIRGTQCHHYRMPHSNYCALHGKGLRCAD